jgi:hypothetical protein
MEIFIDHNRHTHLQYKDNGKTRSYVSMADGSIDCVQLSRTEFLRLKPYDKATPEHFAQTYLKSHLAISRAARAILRGISGDPIDKTAEPSDPRFTPGTVDIGYIAAENNWEPSHCRRFLRKTLKKPGGRWNFSPEEAQKITEMLKEYFTRDSV